MHASHQTHFHFKFIEQIINSRYSNYTLNQKALFSVQKHWRTLPYQWAYMSFAWFLATSLVNWKFGCFHSTTGFHLSLQTDAFANCSICPFSMQHLSNCAETAEKQSMDMGVNPSVERVLKFATFTLLLTWFFDLLLVKKVPHSFWYLN